MFKELIRHPGYIFKFSIYILFILLAFLFYFSDLMAEQDKSLKQIYALLLFVYGAYRLTRTYQEFQKEIKSERD